MNLRITLIKCIVIVCAQIISCNITANIINVPGDHSSIQAAINAATTGDTVLVQAGSYFENISFNGKAITVGSLFLTTGDESYIASTIINGSGSGSCVTFSNSETSTSELTGFTVTNGGAYYGAGINCSSNASPTLSFLEILNNHGDAGDSYGGGLCCMSGASPVCSNLTFTGNDANEGGAVYCHSNANGIFSECVFSGNSSSHGGAMQISYSDPVIDHSLFYENDSPYGGAIYVYNYSTPEFINCTFSENTSTYGGAFYCHDLGGQPTITNCILWDDVCSYNLEIFATSSYYAPIVTYTDVENGTGENWFGTGCIDSDPVFTDPANDEYMLTESSPCIDAGDPASPLDPDGSVADMGAFFYENFLTADFTVSANNICVGETVQFTDNSQGNIVSWQWTFEGGDPPTSTNQNPTVTYNTGGDFDVTLTIFDGTNTNTVTKQNYIHVSVLPAQANTPVGPTDVCGGTQNEYTTQSASGATYYDWQVTPSEAGTITGFGTLATFNAVDSWTGNYTIRVRAGNQCGNGSWSGYLNCTLNISPSLFELSDSGGYCDGSTGIEITQEGSEAGVDYELFLEGVSTGTIVQGTGNEISYGFQTDQGNYSVVGTSGICIENMAGTVHISINYVPEPALAPEGPTSVCAGSTTVYTVDHISGSDTIYWLLTPPESGIIIGNGENISIEWETDYSGVAFLTAQGYNQCGFGDESEGLEVNCAPLPSPEINGLSMVCNEEETDYVTPNYQGSTYDWTVPGGEIINGAGTNQIVIL